MGDEAGQGGKAGDLCSRQHVGALGTVEEGEVALVRHGGAAAGVNARWIGGSGAKTGDVEAAATQATRGGSLAGGVAVLEGDLSKHQQACGRVGEGRRAEEGGFRDYERGPSGSSGWLRLALLRPGACKLVARSQMLACTRTGAATQFRLQPNAQSAVRRRAGAQDAQDAPMIPECCCVQR